MLASEKLAVLREKIEKLENESKEKLDKLKRQERELQKKENQKKQKLRTKRLITIGAVVESALGYELNEIQIQKLSHILKLAADKINIQLNTSSTSTQNPSTFKGSN